MNAPRHNTSSRNTPSTRKPGAWRVLLASVAAALCVIFASLAIHSLLSSDGGDVDIARDMRGNPIDMDSGTVPSSQMAKDMKAVSDVGLRFKVPSVDLDVPLGELTMVGNTITPPGFTSAYLVRNLGVSLNQASTGTVFVAMHSLRGGGIGPGNYLINVGKGTAAVTPGETVQVGKLSYTITGSQNIAKTDIGTDASIWANTPERLVIVTCLQVPAQTPSTHNIAITATLNSKG